MHIHFGSSVSKRKTLAVEGSKMERIFDMQNTIYICGRKHEHSICKTLYLFVAESKNLSEQLMVCNTHIGLSLDKLL